MISAQLPARASAAASAFKPRALRCTQCQAELQPITLEGHYGQHHEADICANCHLVWFDALESVRLSGLGWIGLLRQMHGVMGASAPQTL